MEILMAKDRLTDLPELILLHILSMLPDSKQVVRTSALSKQWRFLWKSVPVSLDFHFPKYPYESKINKKKILAFAASTNRELHYWRSCEKIQAFRVFPYIYKDYLTEHLDFWVHFATNVANVEEFTLQFDQKIYPEFAYLFPQFACTNTSLRKLVLGSPNLECLELDKVCGIRRLDISSLKLRKLIITNYETESDDEHIHWLEIFAPYIRHLELLGLCCDEIRLQLRNVASLVTAVLSLNVDFFEVGDEQDKLDKECRYLQELLHSVAHVKNLELGPWCTEFLSVLELKGRLFPQSSWQFLKLNAALEQLDFPGICSFLQSSLDLETLVIDWNDHKPKGLLSRYTNEDEQSRRFGAHNVNCSLLHLKTIKFINFYGQLSESKFVLPLVKYLLKNATVLKKFVLSGKFKRYYVPRDYVKMEQEFLSIPRSSPHASVVFSY
ncbi:F-box/LRR-repeat protein At3g26922-like isoform X2 [Lycium barbarum]|uniref:F-box/LRR-repeat protein At3g26922-like isoform X2 n=1 Tax=Lycium barbarum TaxID=112863 RepID=UPI00293E535F|nr:F-box/LRR-repeat protein At3g26922-like isoform X2 [Lycium barbarum]